MQLITSRGSWPSASAGNQSHSTDRNSNLQRLRGTMYDGQGGTWRACARTAHKRCRASLPLNSASIIEARGVPGKNDRSAGGNQANGRAGACNCPLHTRSAKAFAASVTRIAYSQHIASVCTCVSPRVNAVIQDPLKSCCIKHTRRTLPLSLCLSCKWCAIGGSGNARLPRTPPFDESARPHKPLAPPSPRDPPSIGSWLEPPPPPAIKPQRKPHTWRWWHAHPAPRQAGNHLPCMHAAPGACMPCTRGARVSIPARTFTLKRRRKGGIGAARMRQWATLCTLHPHLSVPSMTHSARP